MCVWDAAWSSTAADCVRFQWGATARFQLGMLLLHFLAHGPLNLQLDLTTRLNQLTGDVHYHEYMQESQIILLEDILLNDKFNYYLWTNFNNINNWRKKWKLSQDSVRSPRISKMVRGCSLCSVLYYLPSNLLFQKNVYLLTSFSNFVFFFPCEHLMMGS